MYHIGFCEDEINNTMLAYMLARILLLLQTWLLKLGDWVQWPTLLFTFIILKSMWVLCALYNSDILFSLRDLSRHSHLFNYCKFSSGFHWAYNKNVLSISSQHYWFMFINAHIILWRMKNLCETFDLLLYTTVKFKTL